MAENRKRRWTEIADNVALEYLKSEGLIDTWECLQSERLAKTFKDGVVQRHNQKKTPAEAKATDVEGKESNMEIDDVFDAQVAKASKITALKDALEGGNDSDTIFSLWDQFEVPASMPDQESRKKKVDSLTFKLHVLLFAKSTNQHQSHQLFRDFLQGKGPQLAKSDPDLYLYFGLPHEEEPEKSEQFAHIFQTSWQREVLKDLDECLAWMALGSGTVPQLVLLIKEREKLREVFQEELEEKDRKINALASASKRLFALSVKLARDSAESDAMKRILVGLKKEIDYALQPGDRTTLT